jgi:hypothetical protein
MIFQLKEIVSWGFDGIFMIYRIVYMLDNFRWKFSYLNFRRTYKTSPHKTSPRQNVSIQNVFVTKRLRNGTSPVTKRLRNKTSPR